MLPFGLLVRTARPGRMQTSCLLGLLLGSPVVLERPAVGLCQAPVESVMEGSLGFCSKATPKNYLPHEKQRPR